MVQKEFPNLLWFWITIFDSWSSKLLIFTKSLWSICTIAQLHSRPNVGGQKGSVSKKSYPYFTSKKSTAPAIENLHSGPNDHLFLLHRCFEPSPLCAHLWWQQHYFVPTFDGSNSPWCPPLMVGTPRCAHLCWWKHSFVPTFVGSNATLCPPMLVATPLCAHLFW